MLKPLTFSLSLAVALGFCSVSKAGGYDDNCTTCGLASPQGGPYASGQGVAAGCDPPCAPKKHCFSFHMPKIHCNLPKLPHVQLRVGLEEEAQLLLAASSNACDDGGCGPGLRDGPGRCCSVWPGCVLLRVSTRLPGLWCWPACFPACQARDLDRLGPAEMTPAIVWR